MSEMKQWRCKSGHVLGVVRENGSGINQLLLYRHAIDMDNLGAEPEVLAVVHGHVMDISCDICGDVRTWIPGQDAIDELVERVLRRRLRSNFELGLDK